MAIQRAPEQIYVTLTRGRRYSMCVVVPALLLTRPDGYSVVRHVINSWNEMASVPNGEMWMVDLRTTIANFLNDWRTRTTQFYYNAMQDAARKDDTKSGISSMPAEVMWQVATRTTTSLWEQMVQLPCKSVCVIDPDSWPNSRERSYYGSSNDVVMQAIVLSLRLLMCEFPCADGEPSAIQKAAGLRATTCNYHTWWQWHCINIAQQIRTVYLE